MKQADRYQIALIFLGIAAAVFFGIFLWREISPEYKIFQDDYIALEEFRSTYTHEPPPAFQRGVKQLLIEKGTQAPTIDRCISCHVTLNFPHFSPTKIAKDINGNIIRDEQGNPVQIANEDYVWSKLDQKIIELTNPEKLQQLRSQGMSKEADGNLKEAERLESLKKVRVGNKIYDVRKALSMHPLMGKETRPFEFHSTSDFGCVACHNGNGRGLTVEKAHGPVFDDQYEIEFEGPEPKFTETDTDNDPSFARVFNHKPGYSILFQTTPLFPGSLMQAKCMECHQSSAEMVENALNSTQLASENSNKRSNAIKDAYQNEASYLLSLVLLKNEIESNGLTETLGNLEKKSQDFTLSPTEQEQFSNQNTWLNEKTNGNSDENIQKLILNNLSTKIIEMVGTKTIAESLTQSIKEAQEKNESPGYALEQFVKNQLASGNNQGTIFIKAAAWNLEENLSKHIQNTETSLKQTVDNPTFIDAVGSDIDILTASYQKGRHLFFSQACYACHRINALSRGGVGPELSRIGENYPWYVKQSVVWPQADVHASTMPNQNLDHDELEKIVTFLLGQTGKKRSYSEIGYKIAIQEWEAGKKSPWEKPITPSQIVDLKYNMTVFATEGCAACHRLKGYESNVGFAIEKQNYNFDELHAQREWFSQLFPETIVGSELVKLIEKNQNEIDHKIVDGVRKDSLLEEIEEKFPGDVEAFYTPFKYASRAKNHYYQDLIENESDPVKIQKWQNELTEWKARVRRLMMVFIQEYGLGRIICPKLNWSGVSRSDEWLMEHFKNPTSHVPQSLMPVFPFDDTKFYGLTKMLDTLGKKNIDSVRDIWKHYGFNPQQAYELFCSQCHGQNLSGNGPVSKWIYPIPKNLLNSTFLQNLTKERVIHSISHGVNGTPMPPWGEVGVDKMKEHIYPIMTKEEITLLADWIFSLVPGKNFQTVPKWHYGPDDVLKELKNEGNELKSYPENDSAIFFHSNENYYADLNNHPQSNFSEDIFDIKSNPEDGPDPNLYYIKRKFYTSENLQEGRRFFNLNCAACHGKEADGSGARGEIMTDAKPRMLINIDWLNTRDDLRILRSIKYGVPGTSMTPWGDLTTSLQRLQLAMYIRNLSVQERKFNDLSQMLFQAFDSSQFLVENARSENYTEIEKLENEYQNIQEQRRKATIDVEKGKQSPEEATKIYQKELEALKTISALKKSDDKYSTLKDLIKKEQSEYQKIGLNIITKELGDTSFDEFLKILELHKDRYQIINHKLIINDNPSLEENKNKLIQSILSNITEKITTLEDTKNLEEGKISSSERTKKITELNAEIKSLQKTKNEIISAYNEAKRAQEQQKLTLESETVL